MNSVPTPYVLVVDDQSGFRELLKRLLEPAGYEVRTASDAHEAVARIADAPPAVAILDIHMPGPDGLWLADRIRTASPRTAMVLATSDEGVPPVESLKKGIVAYIVKPLRREAVLAAVSDAFRWFASESRIDLSQLGVPIDVAAPEPAPATPAEAQPPSGRTGGARRVLVPVALAAALLGATAMPALYRLRSPARTLDLVASAAGAITVEDESGREVAQGSGFFVEPDTFVTNHHVIAGGTRARIVIAGSGAVHEVKGLLAFDRHHDLALLKSAQPARTHLGLHVDAPPLGENIMVYGAPRGLAGTLSQGIISAHREEHDLLQISAPISPGSSGSPVVNSAGNVVGVAAAYRADGQNLNFAIPALHVQTLLGNVRAVRPLRAAARGAGTDVERHELIGPVKSVTLFASEPYLATRQQLLAEYAESMPGREAAARAERGALRRSRLTLLFDRTGRLVERRLGDDVTKTLYEYDEHGRLHSQLEVEGERTVDRWDFKPTSATLVEAVAARPGGSVRRRLEYASDGRLLSDETRIGDRLLRATRWVYSDVAWPTVLPGVDRAGSGVGELPAEYDGLGNVMRQAAADGAEQRFAYTFDGRGNWLTRETVRVGGNGDQTVTRRERREIQYW